MLELRLLGIKQIDELECKLYLPSALSFGAGVPYGIHTPQPLALACLAPSPNQTVRLLVLLSRTRSACLPVGCHPTTLNRCFQGQKQFAASLPPAWCDPGSPPTPRMSASKERSWGKMSRAVTACAGAYIKGSIFILLLVCFSQNTMPQLTMFCVIADHSDLMHRLLW